MYTCSDVQVHCMCSYFRDKIATICFGGSLNIAHVRTKNKRVICITNVHTCFIFVSLSVVSLHFALFVYIRLQKIKLHTLRAHFKTFNNIIKMHVYCDAIIAYVIAFLKRTLHQVRRIERAKVCTAYKKYDEWD